MEKKENDNVFLEKMLRDSFNIQSVIKRKITLTKNIAFCIEKDSIKMKISKTSVCSNMQKDENAFEAWALIFRRWSDYKKIIVEWEKPDNISNGHYQRFLFRMLNFSKHFRNWFTIESSCQLFLSELKISEEGNYFLNQPSEKRGSNISPKKEAQLENFIVKQSSLKSKVNAIHIDRQLPVGVFKDSVIAENSIFTRGASAIDIWGINSNNELLIFELKIEKNIKVGIISELYFYSCIMKKVLLNKFKYNSEIKNSSILRIKDTIKIKSYFLAPDMHPLIDKAIVDEINRTLSPLIEFHYIKITMPESEFENMF